MHQAWLRNRGTALAGHHGEVWSASFSPDGTHVVTASTDKTARVWDLRGPRPTFVALKGHQGWVNFASFSPDGTHVVTASSDGTAIVSDGLACFAAVTQAGCLHTSIKTGSGKQAARAPAFKWVNTALGNIKAALVGTYRAVREKHVPRYLAEFEYRFNRRYDLQTMIPRLAFAALRTAPMPYRLLKLADVAA